MSGTVRTCPQCGSEYSADIRFCPKDGTTLRGAPGASLIGTVLADRYHILRKLGEGGMGQVFLAEHVKMGRPSAIKVMSPSMMGDAAAISRFNREASNASRIMHPNVAAIYDFGETPEGLIYLAMEYVEGETLTALLARSGALPPKRAAAILRQTASALDAAHERGIVHRDLKPDNIMIAPQKDGSDLVKVVDFGIAKSEHGSQQVTKTGLVIGTPEYMSPEQLSADPVSAPSDTYALALVAFHLLTGSLPFAGGTSQETLLRRLTEAPRTLAQTRPDIAWPPAVQRVLDRGLQRDAALRPASSGEFARDFETAVAGLDDLEAATRVVQMVPPTRAAREGGTAPSGLGARRSPAATAELAPQRTAPGTVEHLPPRAKGHVVKKLLLGAGGLVVAFLALAILAPKKPQPHAVPKPPADTQQFQRPLDSARGMDVASTGTPSGNTESAPATVIPPAAPPPAPPSAERRSPGPAASAPSPAVGVPSAERRVPSPESRARAVVDSAAALNMQGHSVAAMIMIRRALPHLGTLADSVSAFYYLSEAMLQNAANGGKPAEKERACEILGKLHQATTHPLARAIDNMYNQECK